MAMATVAAVVGVARGIRATGGPEVATDRGGIVRATDDLFAGVAGRMLGRGDDSARYEWSSKPSPLLR